MRRACACLALLLGFIFSQSLILTSESERDEYHTYEQALLQAEKRGDIPEEIIVLADLGDLYAAAEDSAQALQYYREAIKRVHWRKTSNHKFLSNLYASAGQEALYLGMATDAEVLSRQAVTYDSENDTALDTLDTIHHLDKRPDYVYALDKDVTRWSNNTRVIRIYIADATDVRGWSPQKNIMAISAFRTWQSALKNRFIFEFSDRPQKTDVTLYWLDSAIQEDGEEASGSNDVTIIDHDMVQSDIRISLFDAAGHRLSQTLVYSTLLHEIGHMLGIRGHSPNITDIMNSDCQTTRISIRDLNTLRRVYQLKPTYTNRPGITLAELRQQLSTRPD